MPFKGREASAYTTEQLNSATVIDIDNDDIFTEDGLNALAETAGYDNIDAMIKAAPTAGTSIAANFANKNTVVQLGKDNNEGGSELQWVPVYLSRSNEDKNNDGKGDAILTLWLATDIYSSTWSDGTYSGSNTTKSFVDDTGTYTVYNNTYDGSFIRHQLNGKSGWTINWGAGNNQSYANKKIGDMVSDFYGSGALAKYVVTPSKVGWQTGAGSGRMKNDPGWAGEEAYITKNYPCTWINDNVWLPSMYEVGNKDITADSKVTAFMTDGGLWGVKVGNICSANSTAAFFWLRSGYYSNYQYAYVLRPDGNASYNSVYVNYGVRPAIHINLESAAEAAAPAHVHIWQSENDDGWVVTKAPTCAEKGEKERICIADDCRLKDNKEIAEIDIDTTAHSWGEWKTTKAPTCTAVGEETRTCSYNDAHKETQPIAQLSHEYAEEFTEDLAPTCTTAGSKSRHCINCDDKIEITTIPKLDHAWGEWITITVGSCTTNGTRRHVCTRDETHVETETITATGHKYVETEVAPTCTEDGYTLHECSVCGDNYTTDKVKATGHTYDTQPVWRWGNNYLTATATFTCSVCHSEHTVSASVTHESASASCTVAGEVTHTATVKLNDKTYTEVETIAGEKLPHDSELVSTVVEPTCTDDGAGQFKCKNCSEEYTDIIPALGHTEEIDEGIEATCTTAGKTEGKHCSVCDTVLTEQTEIPALGHDFSSEPIWTWSDDYFTVTATFVCTRGDNFTIDVAADVDEERTTATCTVAGDAVFIATVTFNYNTYTDTQTVAGTTVPHKYEIVKWEWTDFESAIATYECTECGDSGSASGEAVSEKIEPTCNTEGTITYTVTVEYPYLQKATDTKTETIPATGIHEYKFVSWSWGEDYSASANLQCKTCEEHSSQKVEVSFVDDEENRTFTVTCEIGGETYTDSKTVPLDLLPDDIINPDIKNPDSNSDGNGLPGWLPIAAIAGVILLLLTVIIVVIAKRRHAGYDDDYDYEDDDYEDDDYDDDDYDDDDY